MSARAVHIRRARWQAAFSDASSQSTGHLLPVIGRKLYKLTRQKRRRCKRQCAHQLGQGPHIAGARENDVNLHPFGDHHKPLGQGFACADSRHRNRGVRNKSKCDASFLVNPQTMRDHWPRRHIGSGPARKLVVQARDKWWVQPGHRRSDWSAMWRVAGRCLQRTIVVVPVPHGYSCALFFEWADAPSWQGVALHWQSLRAAPGRKSRFRARPEWSSWQMRIVLKSRAFPCHLKARIGTNHITVVGISQTDWSE